MRSRTLELWAIGASLLLHAAALFGGSWAARSGPLPPPDPRDVWVGRSVFVDTVPERAASAAAQPVPTARPAPQPAARAGAAPALDRVARPRQVARASSRAAQAAAPVVAQRGEFGAEGLPSGVRRLAIAFTRALPAATSRDPVWLSVPLGAAGSVHVEIRVNEAGRIVHTETLDRGGAPEYLARLVERTLVLLRSGRFAVSGVSAGDTEVFRIDVQVSMKDPEEGFEPGQVVRLGFEPPDARGRGKAFFTLGSGRHVEAAIRVERKRG